MKKRIILFGFFVLIFILPFITSLNQTSSSSAIACINNKVQEKGCSTFGLESKIFALLSTGNCKSELLTSDSNDECFVPVNANSCELKTTSQAVLALESSGSDTDKYSDWILAQNKTASGIDWLLQIETSESASCDLKDLTSNQYQVSIDEDKKLSLSGSTNCLNVDSTGYWLKINPQCQNEEFEVSCDKAFQINLLFRKQLSSTIYVFDESVKSETAGGTDFIKARESLCFKKGNSCDYEGSLWATLVLKKLGKDVSSYLPYLIVFEEDNKKFLPESFLYFLTAEPDFKTDLFLKQIGDRYWDEAYDRYYDTAVALMSVSSEQTDARDNAINWLAGVQGDDGCWDSGNVAKTGFLLYSLWPSSFAEEGGDIPEDCEASGNYCVSDIECLEGGGSILSGFSCSGLSVCCSEDRAAQTCLELGGEVCSSSENCDGYQESEASDLFSGESCCIAGTCAEPEIPILSECEENFGTCRDTGCESGEKEDFSSSCDDVSQYCCMQKQEKKSFWWLWVLGILIVLTASAIVFKDKLKDFYDKLTTKKPSPPKPGFPQRRMEMPQRRILPPQQPPQYPRRPIPQRERKSELDDVLKKLKEMGK